MNQASNRNPGVSGMSLYVPRLRVPLRQWCEWTDNPWSKISKVVGNSFRVCNRHENVYTMAANAVLRLIKQYQVDPRKVGFLGLGTESSTDNAAGAVIVRGMVDRGLEATGLPRLSRQLEVPEFKHACLGGVYALKSAWRYALCDGHDRLAVVVSSDIAEYERGSTGEQTQGAGAVAMLIERQPRLFEIDFWHGGTASAYRGPDFRKPFARHFDERYAVRTKRLSDFPVFSGRYSTYSYLDETVHAVEHMLRRLEVSAGSYYRNVGALFFHRPYHYMPVQAMSFLYVRGLARSEHHHQELEELCEEAKVSLRAVLDETHSMPDLYGELLKGSEPTDPYAATSAVAAVLRRRESFLELLEQKMSLGSEAARDLGNLYSAALPAWLAAGFEQALECGRELWQAPLVAVGYGSGDAADAFPIAAVQNWRESAAQLGFARAMAGAVDLTREQYEALHDGDVHPIEQSLSAEFRIARVGEQYEESFQDLGVEYYDYVP